ncbi:MAG: glucose 1-dehydrogenase [Rubricoccaceae bacterium]|nr:glucose 1-dehydrogenase [Rubricoccaceae bacterium]
MRFSDRIAVVTGGAKGIGAATAALFAREAARVAILDTDEAGAETAADLGEAARFVRCNVADGAEVERAFQEVQDALGGVDVLVNNAGIQRYGTVTQTDEALWDEVLDVNLKSAFLCARQALPAMQARGGGVVVNVASVQAFISQQNVAAYTTSKTALLGLTRSIAVDYAPAVRCVAVCPGTVDTPMLRWAVNESPDPDEVMREVHEMHPVKRIATPEEVASLIGYLCSDDAAFITGQAFRIDGGLGLSIGGSKRD